MAFPTAGLLTCLYPALMDSYVCAAAKVRAGRWYGCDHHHATLTALFAAPPKRISFDRRRFAPYLDKLGSDQELEKLFLEFLQERVRHLKALCNYSGSNHALQGHNGFPQASFNAFFIAKPAFIQHFLRQSHIRHLQSLVATNCLHPLPRLPGQRRQAVFLQNITA